MYQNNKKRNSRRDNHHHHHHSKNNNNNSSSSQPRELHPTQYQWNFWRQVLKIKQGSSTSHLQADISHDQTETSYENELTVQYDFDTIEGFWYGFDKLMRPTDFPRPLAYRMFKKGIQPKWEDEMNANGGELRILLQMGRDQKRKSYQKGGRRDKNPKDKIDKAWERLLLHTIGELLPYSSEICGVSVTQKSSDKGVFYRYEVWLTENLTDKSQIQELADEIRRNIELNDIKASYIGRGKNKDLKFQFPGTKYTQKKGRFFGQSSTPTPTHNKNYGNMFTRATNNN